MISASHIPNEPYRNPQGGTKYDKKFDDKNENADNCRQVVNEQFNPLAKT